MGNPNSGSLTRNDEFMGKSLKQLEREFMAEKKRTGV